MIVEEDRKILQKAVSIIQNMLKNEADLKLINFLSEVCYHNAIDKYVAILECALQLKPNSERILDEFNLPGEKSRYFSFNAVDVREPRKIPNTEIYAMSNLSNSQKRYALVMILRKIGFDRETAWTVAESFD